MLKSALRVLLALVAGFVVAFALVVAVEWFSSIVHPLPPDLDGNIPEHVRRYPNWVLAVVVLMYGATGAVAAWVATRIANRVAGALVAVLLMAALIFNLSMLPYAAWFKGVMPLALLGACLLGVRTGRRH